MISPRAATTRPATPGARTGTSREPRRKPSCSTPSVLGSRTAANGRSGTPRPSSRNCARGVLLRAPELNPDHLAADEHAADLVGAGANVEQLRVTVIALDRPVLGVARAAERLHRFVRDLHRILGRVED